MRISGWSGGGGGGGGVEAVAAAGAERGEGTCDTVTGVGW